ncbi:ATP-dependent DNA ligase [Paenibacillus gallinarum]|uniref:ATP-dependent DNA ligase n=1 Tax=Paenibacillus gallinarum TaxID=2762232 RepID=A0ABR8SW61_9BACL|nr:RNA ligase family protein [Paenibacillus gallinarum]MBD7967748.1 ATP-dependent DNA ligase [Paenibacillus gallinarum]
MFINPMLLETAQSPFSDNQYIFEPKIDGHRLIYSNQAGKTKLYTRHRTECLRQYPELLENPFDKDIVLDGEIACVDPETGRVDFELIMKRFLARKEDKINLYTRTLPVTYVVFDILHYDGQDTRKLPLHERKALLQEIPFNNPRMGKTPYVQGAGESLFKQMELTQMEGMVAKRLDSTYVGRRSADWLKVINWTYVDVIIMGYRKSEFGWIAGVKQPDGEVKPAGMIRFGVSPKAKQELYKISSKLKTGETDDYVYLEPIIGAQVKIRNWTRAGKLRDPVFVKFLYQVEKLA